MATAEISFADMIELDLPTDLPADPPEAIEPESTERTNSPELSTWDNPVVSEAVADLVSQEDSALASVGIGDSELYFAKGTRLAEVGMVALQGYDRAYRALPDLEPGLQGLKATIAGEQRRDTRVNLADYRIDVEGRLARKDHALGGHGIALESTAWRQIQAAVGGPNVNAALSTRTSVDRRVRARTLPGQARSVFALVSGNERQGYTVFDADRVADTVLRGCRDAGIAAGAKAQITYDPATTRYAIRAILQAPIDVPAFSGVGRVHQLALDVSGGDDGLASVRGSVSAIRVRCLNASLSRAQGASFERIHRGDLREIERLISGLTRSFGAVASELRDTWARAHAHHYLSPEGGQLPPQEAIARLVRSGLLPTGERTDDQAIDRYVAAWRAEDSPYSAAGVVMAIQRAAHEADWGSVWAQSEIESAASELLYQPVYTLA